MRIALPLVLVAALVSAGCDDSPTQPTNPVVTPSTFTETFAGTLTAGGTSFYSFSVFQSGTVSVMFGSLTPTGTDVPLGVPMTIGFGVPKGTGCDVPSPAQLAPGLTYQLSNTFLPGTYCVNISDPGNLASPADFAIRIVQYPAETVAGEPGTSLFRSDITVGGAATRTFTATKAGTVVIQVTQLGPPDGVQAGLGVGLPERDGSGCSVTVATVTGAPSELAVPVVAGTYCVKIADAGQFTTTVTFSMNIVRP